MFHRVPSISIFAVAATALVLLLAVLFSSSLSSPGEAHAGANRGLAFEQDTLGENVGIGFPVSAQEPGAGFLFSPQGADLPEVSIKAVMPEVAEESDEEKHITVTLKLSRPLRADEKYCYKGSADDGHNGEVCIEGGIIVWDTYDDHLYDIDGSKYDNGFVPSNELIKFVFRNGEVEKRLTYSIFDDKCITPGRSVRIAINQSFDDTDTYGYIIDETESEIPVNGNDETNSDDDKDGCAPVDDGATEEFLGNHAPLFSGQPRTFSVDENTSSGQDIGEPVNASDSDEGDTLTYSLGGTDAASFAIDSSTGQLRTIAPLDHETEDTYHVAVFVRDSKDIRGDPDTVDDDSIDVTINVNNVNEPPVFDANAPTALEIAENTAASEPTGNPITATDPDFGDTLAYSLDNGDGASFGIDGSGQIKTKEPLDRETKDTYNVTLTARDNGGEEATHSVTITVTNVVEPPTFDEEVPSGQNSITRSVAENTPAGRPVGDPVSATSEENDPLTYSLDDQNGTSFGIDERTGQIKTKTALDFEDRDSYTVTVSVTDGKDVDGNTDTTADHTIEVTINVTDVNEPPQFADDAPATLEIAENTDASENIGSPYTATDPENDSVTYSLDSGDGASFEIDTSGQLKTKADLNFEADPSYTVTISVSDSKDAAGTTETNPTIDDTHTVTITVTDEDDPGTLSFSPEQPIAGTTLVATLADQDGVQSRDTWQWEISDDRSTWTEITNATTNSYTPGSGDIDKYLRVTVTYTQTDSSSQEVQEETGAVQTAPPTNQHPSFADATTTRSISENTPAGQPIGDPVAAIHPDNVGTLVYSLDTTGASSFDIDSATGQLKTKTVFDYETDVTSYTVTVSVTDGLDDYSHADTVVDATIDVTITVTDVNEPPQFADDNPASQTVEENTAEDVDIGSPYTATDPDPADTLTYGLTGAAASSFDIDTGTGQIKTKADLDHETEETYTVTVTVSDGRDDSGNTEQTPVPDDTVTVTITLTNVFEVPRFNDEIPQGDSSITRSVPENTATDQPVGAPVSATDDENDTLTYTLGGTDASSFDIDTGTGQILTQDPLDYEAAKNTYAVTVSVSDGKDSQGNTEDPAVEDDSIHVTIKVTDVNEPPQFADDAPITQTVAENTVAETNIGSPYTATDPENDTPLTYSLGGTDAASFAIDDATGQLKTKADLNFEADPGYTVTLSVTDGKDASGTTETNPTIDDTHTVTITITDEDDPGTVTFSPEQPIAGTILAATLADQDGVQSEDTWQWKISTDQSTWTEITDANTNSLVPGSGDIGQYLRVAVTYTQTDGSSKAVQAETDAVLTARPTNQHPSFADATTTRSISENTPAGQPIGDPVLATHPDSVGTLVYSLGGADAASFDIDTGTGQLKTKDALDFEGGPTTYTVTVSVTDGRDDYSHADTVEDASITLTINVNDVNEPPQFADDAATTLELSEDTAIGLDIGDRYEATDPDLSDTVTYSVSGTDAALFQVDANGQLQVKEALDYENKDTLTVIVSASDGRDDSGSAEQTPTSDDNITVAVTVTNVYEAPRFSDDDGTATTTRTIAENTAEERPVGAPVSATDDENDTLTYTLGGTDAASFDFDTTTGQIKTKDSLDHETKDSYSVTVSVSDGKAANGDPETPAQDDTYIDVTIEVTDLNEKPAFDATPPVAYEIAENTAAGTAIGAALTATDPDEIETLTYGLTGTDAASFDIDTSTGQIKTKAALDHETKETNTVTVTVRDGRNDAGDDEQPPVADADIDVTITVTDEDDPGTITLSPTQPSAGNPVTATLEDDDGIKTDVAIAWVWEKSTDLNSWTTITGATTNTYIPQEEDEGEYLRVTATYEDDLGAGKTAQEKTGSAVLDMPATNDVPAFDLDSDTATRSVRENTPAGEDIGDPFTATDTDDTTLTYVLGGTDAASFAIVDITGQIQTKEVLDYENANSKTTYTVTVSVHDGKDSFDNVNKVADATLNVTIAVTNMEVPAIPAQPAVNPTPGAAASLTVTWTAIDPTNDAPVDGYDVQYRVKDPQDNWEDANVNVSGASATITGLEYSTTYEVQVQAKNAEGGSGWSPTGEGSIPSRLDVTLSPATRTVNEGSGATFTVTVSPTADRALSIPVSISSSNAESGDYSPASITVSIASGDTSKTFTISTTDDSDRDNETLSIGFGQLPAAVGAGTQATAQLTINDTTPAPGNTGGRGGGGGGGSPVPRTSLSVSFQQASYIVTEGNSATITVTVSPTADRALSIPISVTLGSAESGDYSVSGTPLSFASGDTSKTFTISTTNDSDMDDETITVGFGQLPAAVGTGTQATTQLTINDTTPAPRTSLSVSFQQASYTVTEGNSATITVTVSPTADRALSIPISVTLGSAESGDYSVGGTPLSFVSGDTSKTFTISTTNDSDRDDETITVGFGQLPAAVGIGTQATAQLTINDTTPTQLDVTFSPASETINEGDSATFSVTVSPAADRVFSIPVTISSSNAESGDYSPSSTSLSFASGDTSKTFTISTISDFDRDDEALTITFGSLPDAVSTGSQATASLTINDTTPAPRTNTRGGGSAKSGGGSSNSRSYTRSSVPVYIPPPSNRAPSFTEGDSTHRSVFENFAARVAIGSPVSATDSDKDQLTYQLGGMDGASFSINANSGQLLTSSVLDFEVQQSYSVYILVSDGNGGSDRIDVTIFVVDVDESPPPVPVTQQAVLTPEPTPVPTPTPEPTEEPTPTPEPTEEPTPTPEPTEEPTPTPEPTEAPTPTPEPTEAPTPTPEPTEAPTPTPEPTPTVVPTPTAIPTAVPTPTLAPTPTAQAPPSAVPLPELPGEGDPQMVAPPLIVDLGNATQPGVGQTTVAMIPEYIRKFRIWPLILLVLGTAMELIALGLLLKERKLDKRKIWAGY